MRSSLDSFAPEVHLDDEDDLQQDSLMAGLAERQSRERWGLDGPSATSSSYSSWDHSSPTPSSSSLSNDHFSSFHEDEDPYKRTSYTTHGTASSIPEASGRTLFLDASTTATLLKLHNEEGIRRQVGVGSE